MQYIDMRVLQVGAKKKLRVADSKTGEVSNLTADVIINAAGLQAQEVVASLAGFPRHKVLRRYLARGCYFTLAGMLHHMPQSPRLEHPLHVVLCNNITKTNSL